MNRTYADGNNEDGNRRFQVMYLLISANPKQLSGVWNYLEKNTLLGTKNYPKTLNAAYDVLCWYKKLTTLRQMHISPGAVTFLQSDETSKTPVPVSNGRFHGHQVLPVSINE